MQSWLNRWPQGSFVAFSVRSSQQIEHLGYSLESCEILQSSSVISTSGRFLMDSLLAGGVPLRPLCCSESRRMCWSMLWSLANERKLRFELPKSDAGSSKKKTSKPFSRGGLGYWGATGCWGFSKVVIDLLIRTPLLTTSSIIVLEPLSSMIILLLVIILPEVMVGEEGFLEASWAGEEFSCCCIWLNSLPLPTRFAGI